MANTILDQGVKMAVGIFVVFLLAANPPPPAFDQIFNASTSNWTSDVAQLWELLPLLGVIALLLVRAVFAFAPAAVRVSPGTTVVWEWTGNGGTHNVVNREDGLFESELTVSEGHTFEYTFEESGEYRYVCIPHETLGMVGVVVVE